MAIHVCCKCMYQMFQLFQMYVASVSSGRCICCSCYTRMLEPCFPNVSTVFIWMLHMLQWLYTYIASVCSKCFTYFRRILQVFYLDVVIYCSGYTHMSQTCVSIVSPGFSMLQQVLLPTRCSAARTHPALPISVMQASSSNQMCT
jgi:hypothetical protein